MIRVKGLSKSYERRQALNGLSFTVEKGEVCALTGLKGAGKTTALDIIAGCMDADAGTVEICGTDIAAETSSARQHIGYVPAEPPVWRDMTPRACLKMNADVRGLLPRESGEKIDAAIKLLGLNDVADTPVKRLSAGAKQMLSIAQAVYFEPEAVIIDEPEQNLNPKEILAFREAVKTLAKDRAVLLASRNLTEMCALCSRVLVMSEGRVVAEGTPDQLHNMTQLADSVTLSVDGDGRAAAEVFGKVAGAAVEGVETKDGLAVVTVKMNGDLRRELFRAAAKADLPVVEMTAARRPLDELLASLVTERVDAEGEGEDA